MKRKLLKHWFLQPSIAEARRYTAKEPQQADSWEIGVTLGLFARKFGARAPLNWISHQLFHYCVRVKIVTDDVVRLHYAHGHTEMVNFQFFCDLDAGIDIGVHDWWLLDVDFLLDYKIFEEERDVSEDRMIWDLIEF